jgi:DNA invertase Pin-like site-specific DNA recombinase
MLLGYARVSTDEQSTDVQLRALAMAGCERIAEEKRSGADDRRPVLQALIASTRPGDALVVYKLDRLSRSLADLLMLLRTLKDRQVAFRSLTESIDTATPAGELMMHMLGGIAQFERSLIVERTRAGMAAAAARGVKLGRSRAMLPIEEAECYRLWIDERRTLSDLARRYDVHVSTIKRVVSRMRPGAR